VWAKERESRTRRTAQEQEVDQMIFCIVFVVSSIVLGAVLAAVLAVRQRNREGI